MRQYGILIGLISLLSVLIGNAYPPTPGVVVTGIVRDEYGWVLRSAGAEVVFRQGDVEITRAPIANGMSMEFNYRVLLPLDAGIAPGTYRQGAIRATAAWTVEIHSSGAVYPPIEVLTGDLPELEAGTEIQLDLTLGEDSDADGLPDDWELWQLQLAGFFPGDPEYNLDQLNATGDFDLDGLSDSQEFFAGSVAVFNGSVNQLDLVGFQEANLIEFDYYATRNKDYQLEWSENLVDWTPVPSSLDDPAGEPVNAWTATRTGWRTIYAPSEGSSRLYRLRVR